MKDYYCFDISFPNIDFDSQMTSAEKSKPIHHAHLYSKENEIEIRILFESKTYLGQKISHWVSTINWKSFGSFIETINANQNDRLEKIDLTEATLLSVKNGSNQYEGSLEYVIVNIDVVKLYWKPWLEKNNTAEFYLNDSGFEALKSFYTPLLKTVEGEFSFKRMNGMDVFYNISKGKFRPEFNFCIKGDKSKSETKIIKEPKLQFIYNESITEEEALKYGEIVRVITSFYFHSDINYTLTRLHLERNTITIKRISKLNYREPTGNFWGFKNFWSFNKFLSSNWQESSIANYDKLTIVINRFLHALDVYDSSKFLIYYSIIEYLKAADKEIKSEFSFADTKKNRTKLCNEAIDKLLEMVPQTEKDEFKTKLTSFRSDLKFRPMKRPLKEFLSKSKLEIENCSIDLKRLVEIRNSLIHGSSEVITNDELEKANNLLYRITGILILQLMGISEWKLNLELK